MSNDELLELVETAAKNNLKDKITGLLLIAGEQFLQVLEGDPEKVNALFQKICRDERHHSVELITFEPTTDPYFSDWNMRLIYLYDLPMEQRRIFMEKYDHEDGEIQIPQQLHLVYSLLLDAKVICLNEPWQE